MDYDPIAPQRIDPTHDQWPKGLSGCRPDGADWWPAQLWVCGNLDLLHAPVAVTGSRACSQYGRQTAASLAVGISGTAPVLVNAGFGIAEAAMRAVLHQGAVPPVVLMPFGINHTYPRALRHQCQRVVAVGGALVSPHWQLVGRSRNTILQGAQLLGAIAQAAVVIDAGVRSNAATTAGAARQLGRPVMAVPGPISIPTSHTSHHLISKHQAQLVTSTDQIVAALAPGAPH